MNEERAKILIKAMVDLLKKQKESVYVLNILEQEAIWDGVECDGECWYGEALFFLLEEKVITEEELEELN